MATVASIQSAKQVSPCRADVLHGKPGVGFLLLDSSLNPVCFNADALQILGYPDGHEAGDSELSLGSMIRTKLLSRLPSGETLFLSEFRSGRRLYFCRAFPVTSPETASSVASNAVLLERGTTGFLFPSRVAQEFKLTQREREVLEFVSQGLDGKAIATRMKISPNTVKAFVRLIMIKMGVSSRTAILLKLMMPGS